MFKKIINFVVILALLVVAGISYTAQAQSQDPQEPNFDNTVNASQSLPGTIRCFDYYHFGSVQVNVASEQNHFVSGETLSLKGVVVNSNTYPIVDGSVYIKVFRQNADQNKVDANGQAVIDQFIAVDHINIPAVGKTPVTFSWKVPNSVLTGQYKIVTFFQEKNKFELLGLTFTNDVVGNTFNFSVTSSVKNIVQFDKASVKVNNETYFFNVPPPLIEIGDATINASLVNPLSSAQTVPVTWKVYSWDSLTDAHLIDTQVSQVALKANEHKDVSLVVKDQNHAVYYVVGEADYNDTKSLLDIRFVRSSVDETRMVFAGVTSFPLVKGTSASIFSCVHGITQDVSPNGKVVLTLKDSKGNDISSYTYTGGVTGAVMGVKQDFVPKDSYDSFTLDAALYRAGKLVDSTSINYDCKTIDPSKCLPPTKDSVSTFVLVGIAIIVLVIILFFISKKKMKKSTLALLFGFVLCSTVFLSPKAVNASQSVVWNGSSNQDYRTSAALQWKGISCSSQGLFPVLAPMLNNNGSGITETVSYNAVVINTDTNPNTEVLNGSVVPIGTHLRLYFVPHVYGDISWNGSGYYSGTPAGSWVQNASMPSNIYSAPYFLNWFATNSNGQCNNGPRSANYISFSVNPPSQSVQNSGNGTLSCGATEADGSKNCTVTGAGTVNVQFTYAPTYGNFYGETCKGSVLNTPGTEGTINCQKTKTKLFDYNAIGQNACNLMAPMGITYYMSGTTKYYFDSTKNAGGHVVTASTCASLLHHQPYPYTLGEKTFNSVEDFAATQASAVDGLTSTASKIDVPQQSISVQFTVPPASTTCANGTTLTYAEAIAAKNAGKISVSALGFGADRQHGIATITNNTGCALPVSLASYCMYDNVSAQTQTFTSQTPITTIAPGATQTVTSNINPYLTQFDLYYGASVTNFYNGNGNVLGGIILGPDGRTFTSITSASGLFCPNPPVTMTATAGSNCALPSINLSWTAVAGATSYQLYTGYDFINSGATLLQNSASRTFSHTGLVASSNHGYEVTAYNGATALASATVFGNATAACGVPNITGYHEAASCTVTSGWSCDTSTPNNPDRVDIYLDGPAGGGGTFLTSGPATVVRADAGVATACGGTANHGFSINLPTIAPGVHTLYAHGVNTTGQNALIGNTPLSINCTALPDLTAGPISPTSVTVGTAGTFSATVSNVAAGPTGTGFTNIFQKATDATGAGVTNLGTSVSAALVAGGSAPTSLSYTFPTAGTYYMRMCADNNASFVGTITETNEGNNCGPWTAINVAALPVVIDGACSSPVSHYICAAGNPVRNTDTSNTDTANTYNWSCVGSNGGTPDTCSEAKGSSSSVNGSCSTVLLGGCLAGDPTPVTNTETVYNWSCTGSNGGTPDTCSQARTPGTTGTCFAADSAGVSIPFANISQLVKWTAVAPGATSYAWSVNGADVILGATGSVYPTHYATIGNKTMWVKIDGGAYVQCNIGKPLPVINTIIIDQF